ncbi:hypothetical protein WKW77_29300 [Variovorax ureilyticus]|uniref:Uncharacterized protein n=1 Tax=Variovorax ureilyticus TaxID=1836198 RepID=A0ABU8VNG4_9BURK
MLQAAARLLVILAGAKGDATHAAEPPCKTGWLTARAMITRVDPPDLEVFRLDPATGVKTRVSKNAVLCDRQALVFDDKQTDATVELLEGGKRVLVKAGETHVVPSGASAVALAIRQYVDAAWDAAGDLQAPLKAEIRTNIRNGQESNIREPLRLINALRRLSGQVVAAEVPVHLAWRAGLAPYTCEGQNMQATVVATLPVGERGDCTIPLDQGTKTITRLAVVDSAGQSAGVNFRRATAPELPRPDWIAAGKTWKPDPEGAAWAMWLWREGGPTWRLQAIALLQASASTQFPASLLYESILAEAPAIPPR